MYNKPKSISATAPKGTRGITAQIDKLIIKKERGANINNKGFAEKGITVSLNINFAASAIGCNKPIGPTIVGPNRRCIEANAFRSSNVKKATAISRGKRKTIILIVKRKI